MTTQEQEKRYKKFGQVLEQTFSRLNEGIAMVECIDKAETEREREVYTALAALQAHHSWHMIVRLFRRIGHAVDKEVPRGPNATSRLIEQMMQRTNNRPSILKNSQLELAQKLNNFHRNFRNGKDELHSRREIIDFIESMNDEIVPDILESVRVMALASPGGAALLTHLRPKNFDASVMQVHEARTA